MTHNDLVLRAALWLRAQGYHAVLVEPMLSGIELPDAIGWDGNGRCAVIECKVSRSDFRADLKKRVHKVTDDATLGNHRWYMVPRGLLKAEDVPKGHGLLEVTEHKVFVTVKAPRRVGHAETHERAMMAVALGRVQRDHFAEAFACPEGYLSGRMWVRDLPFLPDPPEKEAQEEIALAGPPEFQDPAYSKVACADRLRRIAGRIIDFSSRRGDVRAVPLGSVALALAHLRRAERLLLKADPS